MTPNTRRMSVNSRNDQSSINLSDILSGYNNHPGIQNSNSSKPAKKKQSPLAKANNRNFISNFKFTSQPRSHRDLAHHGSWIKQLFMMYLVFGLFFIFHLRFKNELESSEFFKLVNFASKQDKIKARQSKQETGWFGASFGSGFTSSFNYLSSFFTNFSNPSNHVSNKPKTKVEKSDHIMYHEIENLNFVTMASKREIETAIDQWRAPKNDFMYGKVLQKVLEYIEKMELADHDEIEEEEGHEHEKEHTLEHTLEHIDWSEYCVPSAHPVHQLYQDQLTHWPRCVLFRTQNFHKISKLLIFLEIITVTDLIFSHPCPIIFILGSKIS